MPVGKALGFSYLVLLVVPVIVLLVRRRWRLSVTRSEEIKRLLVLASEEDARAEIEASTCVAPVNSVYRPLQCQCSVCFCPTTTRCASSTKCQIIHWRQGHKDKCRPFATSHHIDEVGDDIKEKALKQDDNKIRGHCVETEGRKCAKSNQNSPNEPLSAESNCPPRTSYGHDDCEVECLLVRKGISSSLHETETLSVQQSTNIVPDELVTNCVNSVDPNEQTSSKYTLGDSVYCFTGQHRLNQSEINKTDHNIYYGSTSSCACHADVTTKSSLSVPSASSGFQEGAVKPSRPRIEAHDDSVQMAFSGADDGNRHSSQSFDGFKASIRCLSPKRSNHVVNGTVAGLHPQESEKVGYLSSSVSAASLSSSTRRHSCQGAKPAEDNRACEVGAGTSEFSARNGVKVSIEKVDDLFRPSKSPRHSQLRIVGRYSNKGLFPYDLFVKLYSWNKIKLCPCGLKNCGNSCYANAVIQCLAFTPPLTAYLLQRFHSKACERKDGCFTCELESLILKTKEGSSTLSPIGILSNIQSIGCHLRNGQQEDAHEFLRYAINKMQSVCLKEAGVNASAYLAEDTTLIGLIFGGYLQSKVKCMKCRGISEQHERMMDLTIEIEGDAGTLEEALRLFTGTEILDGENQYKCSRCKSYQRAKKKLKILEAPNVLTVALKRFRSGKFGKLNKLIQFPEILNLAPYISGTSDKSPIYKLYGVVVHLDIGNAAFSGHYICYVNVQSKWFKIDDSVVKAVGIECVLAENAYMLLYARCSPRAPRLIRNSIVSQDPRKIKYPCFKSRSNPVLYSYHSSFQHIRPILEDESSDNCSSIFTEECSCSTRDSTSTDDYDQFIGDVGENWNSLLSNSSGSESPSSSPSPSPFPSPSPPLYEEHDMDMDSLDLRARPSSRRSNSVSVPLSYSDII
ncbi:Ubiquitinyl hydrolase 1 [Bertholletia excelsa]